MENGVPEGGGISGAVGEAIGVTEMVGVGVDVIVRAGGGDAVGLAVRVGVRVAADAVGLTVRVGVRVAALTTEKLRSSKYNASDVPDLNPNNRLPD